MTDGIIKAERKRSWKASTAAAWGSTEKYRKSYDETFSAGCSGCKLAGSLDSALLHLEVATHSGNQHRLAQIKQVLHARECRFCEPAIKRALDWVNGVTDDV